MRSAALLMIALAATAELVPTHQNPAVTTSNKASHAKTTLASISPCGSTCAWQVAQRAGCDDATGFSCLCTSTSGDFKNAIAECIITNCNEEEQAAASDFL
ncbi:hypothetical protein FRC01_002914, partial [Tulasnella sp. 417]